MRKLIKGIFRGILILIYAVITTVLANYLSFHEMNDMHYSIAPLLVLYLLFNIFTPFFHGKLQTRRLRNSANGCDLLMIFLLSFVFSCVYYVMVVLGKFADYGLPTFSENIRLWIVNTLLVILVEAIVFWNGILRIYVTSEQLGIKWRMVGLLCGLIPVVHFIILGKLLLIVKREVVFENKKLLVNQSRKEQQICKTKYPILLVHGVFFRDFRYFNYWGRIPKELEENGAVIYYGNQKSADSVEACAKELDARIRQIVKETGCEKVNVIAHSKGGLDMRYALSCLGTDEFVATLTTINTPHRGCEFADYLLSKIPESQKEMVASTYNKALGKLGEVQPDFLAAVYDLTAENCAKRNEFVKDAPGVRYRSVGSKLNVAKGGRFPLNFSYLLVKHFDGANDGLVGEASFPWGEDYRFITIKGRRGISHGDMIDLNRENFKGFDVREFYVELAGELKERGF